MRTDLCGKWTVEGESFGKLQTEIPGSVLSALIENGIVQDPYFSDNELKVREYLKGDCVFRRTFRIEKGARGKTHYLFADGLDTICDIYINNVKIASSKDMHLRLRAFISDEILKDENEIKIVFESPYRYIEEYPNTKGLFRTFAETERKSPCIRKANYMFGWDWGPNLADTGIYRDIYLLSTDTGYLSSFRHKYVFNADGSVKVNVSADYIKNGNGIMVARLYDDEQTTDISCEATLSSKNEFSFDIKKPKLWYPVGIGEQPLYNLTFTVYGEKGEEQKYAYRIGIKEVRVDDGIDEYGKNFAVYVNGIKVFLKGSNFIPEDMVLQRVTPERTERLLRLAKEAEHNCIRVWGGGYYPSEDFYDRCDEYGLLVFEDLMFACASYSMEDREFRSLIANETQDALRRIRHHASIAIISGDNECEDGIHGNGEDIEEQYRIMRTEVIEPIIRRETDFYFLPSSPSSANLFEHQNDMDNMDTHYWAVWHSLKPIEEYETIYPRMLSEFGCQSFPTIGTVKRFVPENELYSNSYSMTFHQRDYTRTNDKILYYVRSRYKEPKCFEDEIYLSSLVQAEAMKICVEHLRMNKFRCNGAIYWQLNDVWPGMSESSVDYYFGLKATHYFAKHFFAPHLITAKEVDGIIKIGVANDTGKDCRYNVSYRYCDFNNHVYGEDCFVAEVAASSCKWVYEKQSPFTGITEDKVLLLELKDEEGILLSRDIYRKDKDADSYYDKVNVTVENIGDNTLKVTADGFAKNIYLQTENDAGLSDNYFTLFKGESRIITAERPVKASEFKIRTVNNVEWRK